MGSFYNEYLCLKDIKSLILRTLYGNSDEKHLIANLLMTIRDYELENGIIEFTLSPAAMSGKRKEKNVSPRQNHRN